jgi:UDP-N-acetylmuramoyl-tripeptide--D-alanyl-D-alanine ligase
MKPNGVTVAELTEACKGRLMSGDPKVRISSFSTDTRTLKQGDLFIALRGKTFDGHDFLQGALKRGAVGVVISSSPQIPLPAGCVVIQVRDTEWALGEMANLWRRRYLVQVVAITGTNGKTTTKEMSGSVLRKRYRVLTSPGNLNNLIGLPLSLFQLRQDHEVAVLELGMSARGEIHRLAEIAEPDVGVITNIGEAHLEFLGSVGEVAEAKGELLPFLAGERLAILNLDDPYLGGLLPRVRGRLLTFGLNSSADVRGEQIRIMKGGRTHFTLVTGGRRVRVHLNAPGYPSVYNALAAAAVGFAFGLDLELIVAGLEEAKGATMRMQKILHPSGAVIVNDAYNANPSSMAVALETFFIMVKGKDAILVLGDMLELGAGAEAAHRRVGAVLGRYRPGRLITLGERAREIGAGAEAAGLDRQRIHHCQNHSEAREVLRPYCRPGHWIFLKASRGMHLEKVLEGL